MTMTEAEYQERRAFLERRQGGMGGSDIPVLLGLVANRNALDVYHSKTRPIREEDVVAGADSIHLLRGRELEDKAGEHYWRQTDRRGRLSPRTPARHPDYPHVAVSTDGVIFSDPERAEPFRETGTLELKCPSKEVVRMIADRGVRDSELVQLQAGIAAARHAWGSLAWFTLEEDRGPIIKVDRAYDPDIGPFLLETSERFYVEHVLERVPPDPDDWELAWEKAATKEVRQRLSTAPDLLVVGPEEDEKLRDLVAERIERKRMVKEAEALVKEIDPRLEDYLAQRYPAHDRFEIPGLGKLTNVRNACRETFSAGALEGHRPIDRDKLHNWLNKHADVDPETLLAELELDLDRFRRQGDPYNYLLTTPKKG